MVSYMVFNGGEKVDGGVNIEVLYKRGKNGERVGVPRCITFHKPTPYTKASGFLGFSLPKAEDSRSSSSEGMGYLTYTSCQEEYICII